MNEGFKIFIYKLNKMDMVTKANNRNWKLVPVNGNTTVQECDARMFNRYSLPATNLP